MIDNTTDECIICFNIIIYPNYQIALNCSHKLCANCYNQIINNPILMRKCPGCRQDIDENFNHILYIPIDNLDNQENIEISGNNIFNCINLYTIIKNILLCVFFSFVLLLLILMLGIISKYIYK